MKMKLRWRLIALAALVSFGLIILSIFELAFSNPLVLVFLLIAITCGAFAIWLIFTGVGKRLGFGWALLGISAVIITFLLYQLTVNFDDPIIIRIALLAILYGFLVGILRREYWRQKRASAQKHISERPIPQAVLIINPKSGNGRAIKANIPQKAEKLGITTIITKKGDSIEGLARQAVKDGAEILGVSGGDGTLGAVAKVAIETNSPLVVLPGGTRCHFARDVGLDPNEIRDALTSFQGVERRVDVGSINGRIFLNNASFGVYADVVDRPEYRNNKLHTTRTVLRSLLNGDTPYYPLKFVDNNKKKHTHAAQILVGVNAYETVNVFELGHRHTMNAGILQITAITKLTDDLITQLLGTIVLNQGFTKINSDHIYQWHAKNFTVSSKNKKLVVGVDGEREEYSSPVSIKILPKALRLMVPPEGMRPRPHSPMSKTVLSKLLQGITGKIN